jgi:glutamate transport system permease protein
MTRIRWRPSRPGRGTWVRLALLVAAAVVVVVLFATGVLPEDRWRPFSLPRTWSFLAQGLGTTLSMGAAALVGSLAIGIPLGMARSSLRGVAGRAVALWIEAVRATPILAILLICYLGLSRLGIGLDAFEASVIGLTVYNSAIIGEIVRAGIGSLPRGEVDAARSLGMSYWQSMRLVVLPQALARMMPAIVSQLVTLVKDTSLAFIVGAQELVGFGRSVFVGYGNVLETYVVIAIIFFIICFTLSRIARRLEQRQPVAERVVVTGEEDQVATAAA